MSDICFNTISSGLAADLQLLSKEATELPMNLGDDLGWLSVGNAKMLNSLSVFHNLMG